jgi:hypothetical protein
LRDSDSNSRRHARENAEGEMTHTMPGEQYKKSLNDDHETYFKGERMPDLVRHPLIGECVGDLG